MREKEVTVVNIVQDKLTANCGGTYIFSMVIPVGIFE
jgi:hypothetical protein